MAQEKVRIIITYSKEDDAFKDKLIELLKMKDFKDNIEIWLNETSIHLIPDDIYYADSNSKDAIKSINIFFVSPSTFSRFNTNEQAPDQRINEFKKSRNTKILPIIIREINREENFNLFRNSRTLPIDGMPLVQQTDKDKALSLCAMVIEIIVDDLLTGRPDSFPSPLLLIEQEKEDRTGLLNLANCGFETIPDEVLTMDWLTELQLGLDETLGLTKNKHKLLYPLIKNNITAIPAQISQLINLQKLNLQGNEITDISPLASLSSLTHLDAASNQIEDITPLKELKNLQWLNLYHNQIKDISPLTELTQLEYVRLSTNQITDVSPLADLDKLQTIRLSNNNISDVSPLFPQIERGLMFVNNVGPTTMQISITRNPIPSTDLSFIMGGRDAQLAYITSLQENLVFSLCNVQKVILLGNSNCGKTTLRKYLKNDPDYKNQQTTTKLEIEDIPWVIEGRKEPLHLRFLDFGGQEYFHGTYSLFFSLETIYIVVWAAEENKYKIEKSRETFADNRTVDNEDFDVSYWLNSIDIITANKKSYTEDINIGNPAPTVLADPTLPVVNIPKDIPVLLIQNKFDKDGILYEDIQRHSTTFTRFDIDTVSISLYNGFRLELFKKILENKITESKAHERQVPDKWTEILKGLNKNHIQEKIIDYKTFHAIARKKFPDAVKFNDRYFIGIAKYFHATHEFIYFGDINDGLIVLDIEWFINAIYKLISGQTVLNEKGVLTKENIQQTIGNNFLKTAEFIAILKYNDILFDHGTAPNETYILPQLMPTPTFGADKLLYDSFEISNVVIQFNYHLHRITIQDLYGLLQTHNTNLQNTYLYKNGVIIKKNNGLVFLQINQAQKCIEFKTTKQSAKNNALIKEIIFDVLTDKSIDGYLLLNKLQMGKDRPELCICLESSLIPISKIEKVAQDIKANKKVATINYDNEFYELIEFSPFTYLMNENIKMPKRLFISYSHKDTEIFNVFVSHLQNLKHQGYISTWHDQMLLAGDKWDQKILTELKNADIVVFLMSQDFINSKYIQEKEFRETYKGLKTVIPILVRSCEFGVMDLKDDQFANKEPLSQAKDLEDAVVATIKEIRMKLEAMV